MHRALQKSFDEPCDCTGLHFIQRDVERKVARSQLGSINLEEEEKKNSSGHQSKAVDRDSELYEVVFT